MAKWKVTTGKNGTKALRFGSLTLLLIAFHLNNGERTEQEFENEMYERIGAALELVADMPTEGIRALSAQRKLIPANTREMLIGAEIE